MADKLPHDFEQKVRMAPAVGGKGYPYQLSAKHLMDNFRHVNKDQEETGLPDGVSGDILRHDGDAYVSVTSELKIVIMCVDGAPENWVILRIRS
tara:strand:+ start:531 stop:812 length:282 start_codon:yes stop_codon:yes gene_type:complete